METIHDYYTSKICSTRLYVRAEVVAAMKQPMEADVSGGTAEAVFWRAKRPCRLFVGNGDGECRSCRSDDTFICLLLEYLVNNLQRLDT